MLRFLARLLRPRPTVDRIALTADGFGLWQGARPIVRTTWNDIGVIEAFKKDLITVDSLHLEISLRSRPERIILNEETEGSWDLVREIKRVFPESRANWETEVIKPAFAERRTIIFNRQGSGAQ